MALPRDATRVQTGHQVRIDVPTRPRPTAFCEPHIRIDRFGSAFSALDVLSVLTGWTLTSSKGGVVSALTGATAFMAGDLWTDIVWLELSASSAVSAPAGIDNLRLAVPEPSMFVLLLAALAATAWARSRPSQLRRFRINA